MSEPSEWAHKLAADYWDARYQPGDNMVDILAPLFDAARAEGAAEERARASTRIATLEGHIRALLAYEMEGARIRGLAGCTCIGRSKRAEQEYERGCCPHQLAAERGEEE